MPEPAPPSSDWTGPRPIVTGAPVVVGAAIVGIVLLAMFASIGRKPGLPALLSQDYTAMMAGEVPIAEGVKQADAELNASFARLKQQMGG